MTATLASPSAEPEKRSPRPRPPAARLKRRRLLVVGMILAGAAGFLLYKTLTSAVVYFKTASEAVHARSSLGTSTFQMEGVVVKGTIHERADVVSFSVSSGRVVVPVVNSGTPPQLFQANVPVVLVGHFAASGDTFYSDQILVKHSNSYIAAHPKRVAGPNGKVVR